MCFSEAKKTKQKRDRKTKEESRREKAALTKEFEGQAVFVVRTSRCSGGNVNMCVWRCVCICVDFSERFCEFLQKNP